MATENEDTETTTTETTETVKTDAPVAEVKDEQPDPLAAFDAGLAELEPAEEEEAEEPVVTDGDEVAAVEADPVEDEVKDLKLGERSAERFRELAKSEKALAPIRELAEKEGVALEDLPSVFERARERDDFVRMVSETGASPEQFGKLLDYQSCIHAASQGDLKAAETAYAMLLPEVQALAGLLGKDIAGIADPLDAHPDLLEAVEEGDISRKLALEQAKLRNRDKIVDTRRVEEDTAVAAQEERAAGVDWLNRFEAHMKVNDTDYEGKRPALLAFVETIGSTLPPSKWPEAVKAYYGRIAAPAPVVMEKPRPGPMRARPTPAVMTPEKFDSPMAAFEHGLSSVGG